ncbi:MAG: 3-hydroxy-3-methylglutaryl-CoA lyase [Pseudomonadota bacterium]
MWITDEWWTSEFNFREEVREGFNLPTQVLIHDATLRDGEQTPGVVFQKEEKVAIAKALDAIGVDRIEAGMPAVSPEDMEAMKAISSLGLKAKIMAFSRAMASDIDKAVECGVWGIVLEVPGGLPRLKYQFNWSEDEVIRRSIEGINYAKKKGLYVCLFPYDTTRAEFTFIQKLVKEVTASAEPDSIAIVDTTGCILPEAMRFLVAQVKSLTPLPIEVHTHNDFGLAIANSLAAVEAGAEVVHVCVNGLGERCGNAALEEIAVSLKILLGVEVRIKLKDLYELSQLAEKLSGVKLAVNKPIVGDIPFTRESGLGVDVFKENPRVAFGIHPGLVNRKFQLVLGKKSGAPSIKEKLNEIGISATEEQIRSILTKVKSAGYQKKGLLNESEFKEIVTSVLQNK